VRGDAAPALFVTETGVDDPVSRVTPLVTIHRDPVRRQAYDQNPSPMSRRMARDRVSPKGDVFLVDT
jgi:hypothetical protein